MEKMNKKQISILNKVEELHKLNAAVEELIGECGLSKKLSMEINLVLEEIVSNIIFYGFEDKKEHLITIDFEKDDDELKIVMTDEGSPFDILSTEEFADVDKSAEEREIGGLGIHFVKTLMDRMEYQRRDNKNILTLSKNIAT